MKEIEVLVEIKEPLDSALAKLKKADAIKEAGTALVIDEYYYKSKDEQNKDVFSTNEWFRIRKKGNKTLVTYKKDNFKEDGSWFYSDEYETEIADHDTFEKIVRNLGMKTLVVVKNNKHEFIVEDNEFEIVVEDVENLGVFMEIEKLNVSDKESDAFIDSVRKEIKTLISKTGIKTSEEMHVGKPEMLIEKNRGPLE